jgi:hypothetical protein
MEEYRNNYLAEEDNQHDLCDMHELDDQHDLGGKARASGDQGHDTDTGKLDNCTVS